MKPAKIVDSIFAAVFLSVITEGVALAAMLLALQFLNASDWASYLLLIAPAICGYQLSRVSFESDSVGFFGCAMAASFTLGVAVGWITCIC